MLSLALGHSEVVLDHLRECKDVNNASLKSFSLVKNENDKLYQSVYSRRIKSSRFESVNGR